MPRTKELLDTVTFSLQRHQRSDDALVCTEMRMTSYVRVPAMAQAVGRRPVIAEDRLQFQVSPGKIWRGHSGTRTGFFPVLRFYPVSIMTTDTEPLTTVNCRVTFAAQLVLQIRCRGRVCGASVSDVPLPGKSPITNTSFLSRATFCGATNALVEMKPKGIL
jgi:hypothetical protein